MTLRLTIAIPTYNRAGLLVRALESALAQTTDRVEILVSDNGSTDDTPRVIERFHDRRLRVVRRESTVSRAEHGTLIFSLVNTPLVVMLSDDDYLEPNFAEEVLRLFDEHGDLSFAYTGCIEHYDDQAMPALVGPRRESPLDFIAAHYAGRRQVSWCACVMWIDDLRRHGPQPEDRICGDMYFWTRIAFQGPVGCVSRPLAHYTALIPGGDNESRTTPVIAWAKDVSLLAHEVTLRVVEAGATQSYRKSLEKDMGRYIARSTANQFIWARIFGMRRRACLCILPVALRLGRWNVAPISRVGLALLLPRRILRTLVVRSAARMAARRHSAEHARDSG
jgi:hypothetical protein